MKSKTFTSLFAVLLIVGILGIASKASATLVDDYVTAQHYYGDLSSPWSNLGTTTVTDDDTDVMNLADHYLVDVNASSLSLDRSSL